jgi:hypothetical protein
MRLRRATLTIALALVASVAGAAPIIVIEDVTGGTGGARSAAALATLYPAGSVTVLEDFEGGGTPIGGAAELVTGVGTFRIAAGNSNGTGVCFAPCDGFYVLDESATPFDGRYNATEGGERWLDSNDTTSVELTLRAPLTNLFFFITDVNDVNGTLSLVANDGSISAVAFPGAGGILGNGRLFLVRITSAQGIRSLRLNNSSTRDGWGVDDFGTFSVTEPASALALGAGLLLVALVSSRLRSRQR